MAREEESRREGCEVMSDRRNAIPELPENGLEIARPSTDEAKQREIDKYGVDPIQVAVEKLTLTRMAERISELEEKLETARDEIAQHDLWREEAYKKLETARKALENIIDTLTDSLYSETRRIEKAIALAAEKGGE
jgi:hypothetical protein